MVSRYYKKSEDVLFFNPITRFLAKVFGPEKFIIRCKECGKIPTEMYGEYCFTHREK